MPDPFYRDYRPPAGRPPEPAAPASNTPPNPVPSSQMGPAQPYGSPPAQPYAAPQPEAYPGPPQQPYGAPPAQAYPGPGAQPYAGAPAQPYAAQPPQAYPGAQPYAAYAPPMAAPFATQTITAPAPIRRRKGFLFWLIPAIAVVVAGALTFAIVTANKSDKSNKSDKNNSQNGPADTGATERVGGEETGYVDLSMSDWSEVTDLSGQAPTYGMPAKLWARGRYDRITMMGYGQVNPDTLEQAMELGLTGVGSTGETLIEHSTLNGRDAWHGRAEVPPDSTHSATIHLEAWIVLSPNGEGYWVSAESDDPNSDAFGVLDSYQIPDSAI